MRSGFKVLLFMTGAMIGCLALWGPGLAFKAFAALAALSAAGLAMDGFSVFRNDAAAGREAPDDRPGSASEGVDVDFQDIEGETDLQRMISINGQPAIIRVSKAKPHREAALPHASKLCTDTELASRFVAFKASEAARTPKLAQEILSLEIESINFPVKGKPNAAEVSFTPESGGEPWTCMIEDGSFGNLRREG